MRYLLDTNICIYVIKNHPPEVRARLERHPLEDVGVSAVTVAELEYGVAKSARPGQNALALGAFLAPLRVAAFDDGAARRYGELRAALERAGTPIGSMDMLIAAHALSLGAVLVTNNVREFGRVPGLGVENWLE